MKYRYCYHCGKPTIQKEIEGRQRSYCKRCRIVLYENPIPSVAVVLTDRAHRILLVRRSVEPGFGKWCLPGGFMEMGETPQQAAIREIREELGIDINDLKLLDIGTHLNGYYGDVLIIGFAAEIDAGLNLNPGDDVSDAKFYLLDERPELVFRVHENFIRTWRRRTGL